MKKAKKAALYVRVSTADQTVDNQVAELERVAEFRGWEIVTRYSDLGISGAKGRQVSTRSFLARAWRGNMHRISGSPSS
jgi:DNA invertase Pin-like site-specific DNA recombinase